MAGLATQPPPRRVTPTGWKHASDAEIPPRFALMPKACGPARSVNLGTDQRTGTGTCGTANKGASATTCRPANRRASQGTANGAFLGVRASHDAQS